MDFFPNADVGLIKLHVRAPPGTRIEDTERLILQVEDSLRQIIPADELDTINDTVGVPSSFNLAFVPSDNVGSMDAEILISLKRDHHPTIGYIRSARICRHSSRAAVKSRANQNRGPECQLKLPANLLLIWDSTSMGETRLL